MEPATFGHLGAYRLCTSLLNISVLNFPLLFLQAGFRNLTALVMGFFFAITTPLGIGIGMGIATTYNENSPTALIVQGVFDSISGGILVYMALVDLIAADFLSKRMRSSRQLQISAFLALFLGAGCMSVIGVWA